MPRDTRKPLISGNWKMHHNHFEAIQTVQKLSYLLDEGRPRARRRQLHPPFTDLRTVQTVIDADKLPIAARRPALPLGGQGRVHRRGLAGVPRQAQRALRDRRPLRAARAVRRDRRDGRQEGRRRSSGTDDADRVRRRDARGARGGRDRGARCSARSAPGSPGSTAEQVAALVVAYEPIWAIGTGRTATADDAQAVCARDPRDASPRSPAPTPRRRVRIQYGGIGEGRRTSPS